MARVSTVAWLGVALGIALAPAEASAQDPAAKTTARAAEQAQSSGPAARLAYQAAMDSYRRGDYDYAAAYFQQAQAGQQELSAAERRDLATWLQLNGTALQARREGRNYLNLAEQAVHQGHTQDAIALLKAVIPNQQFLTAADKQHMQQLSERLMPGNAGTVQAAGSSAAPLFQARTKLNQARILLSHGKYDAAQALAIEADRLGATYQPGEDTPQKVFEDINRARMPSDANSLLAAARAALNRGNFDEAERLANAADKATPVYKVYLFGDSPSKVLKDVKAARARQLVKREAQEKTGASSTGSQALKPLMGQSQTTTAAAGDQPQVPAGNPTEAARQLLKAAHKALQAGNVAQAKELSEKARQLKPELSWWEDTPDKLQDEIRQVESVKQSKDVKESIAGKDKWDDPRSLLKQGRQLYEAGKLNEAQTLAQRANTKPTRWSMFEDTPDKLLEDINDARAKREREESVRVLAEARKTYEKGDLTEAERLANRAQHMHGPYKFWELGDRPQKLLAEIETAKSKQRKPNLPPAPSEISRDAQTSNHTPQESAKTNMEKPATVAVNPPPVWPSSGSRSPGAGERVTRNSDRQSPYLQTPPSMLSDGKKVQAQLLLTQARQLQREGRLLESRQKALEAQRVGASFGPQEDRPELALLAVSALCQKRIESLVQHATDYLAIGEVDPSRYQRAEYELTQAKQLAVGFELDTQLIQSKLNWLQQMRARKPLPESSTGRAQITPVQHLEMPPAQAASSAGQGQTLLNQARMELRAGQTGNARRLAEAAYAPQYGVQAEAAQVLRSIDAEEFNQKILTAHRTFEAGLSAFYRREYSKAGVILRSVDPRLLAEDKQNRLKEIMLVPEMQPSAVAQVRYPAATNGSGSQPGVARVSDAQQMTEAPRAPAVSPEADFAQQFKAMQEVKFQELRTKGMEKMTEATKRFEIGETDRALEILQEYSVGLQNSDLDSAQVTMLRRQVDARLQRFRMLKDQQDFQKLQVSQRESLGKTMTHAALAEQDKKKQLTELMNQYHTLFKQGKYKEAEMYAMQAHELDPDDAMSAAAIYTARTQNSLTNARQAKTSRETMFDSALTGVENEGPYVDITKPLSVDLKTSQQNRDRKSIDILSLPNIKSEREREIYRKLDAPISSSMDFKDMPLQQVLDDLRVTTGINIIVDESALHEAGIVLTQPMNMRLEGVALKSALNLLLKNVHLTYVVQDEVLNITTEEHARGKRVTKIHPVPDLVIPVNNAFAPDPLAKALGQGSEMSKPKINNNTPWLGQYSMAGGQNVSSMSQMVDNPHPSSGAPVITKESPKGTIEDVLIKLITNTIAPQSWASMGGQGTIEYFPLGFALVINQTPDVQEQIQELLQALRRLQDQEVAVELRFITVAEEFYERIGLDFSINIRNNQTRYEPQIVSQQFKPFGFINHFNPQNFITGLTPAGSFTQDLNIPIKATSFNMGIPPFGGFPNAPGSDGGLSLGLAFLSDIEVYLLMDAAQGDQRTNVMQAPKLTMQNGQAAEVAVGDQQFFVVGVTVLQVGGQVVFTPANVPIPTGGIDVVILPTISADRRFVRLSITPLLTNLASANVPLFPITTFITPIFEGGAVGQPIPFTQFLQQPAFSTVTVNTTVNVPDGGTVLVGGLKRLSEGRNEYGPPVLSKIPYLNRLFKNVGYGRETESLLMMITPRIIINEEEETKLLGPAGAPAGAPGAPGAP